MALGNANTSAQARGKAKPVMVKRRKEVVMAKGYNSFQISEPLRDVSNAQGICASSASLSQTVYHNGSSAAPGSTDLIYTRPRANERYLLQNGFYKASVGGANNYLLVDDGDGTGRLGTCR